jgi:hypothetical protein
MWRRKSRKAFSRGAIWEMPFGLSGFKVSLLILRSLWRIVPR